MHVCVNWIIVTTNCSSAAVLSRDHRAPASLSRGISLPCCCKARTSVPPPTNFWSMKTRGTVSAPVRVPRYSNKASPSAVCVCVCVCVSNKFITPGERLHDMRRTYVSCPLLRRGIWFPSTSGHLWPSCSKGSRWRRTPSPCWL